MPQPATPLLARQGLLYGLLGLPLAFAALPLYVLLPHHYASAYGMPLATLGAVLLGARVLDAVTDPLLGRWIDGLFARSDKAVLAVGALACALLAAGMAALVWPLPRSPQGLTTWALGALMCTGLAYSVATIAHQSWGAQLGDGEALRSRVVAWREGAALVGVLLASALFAWQGITAMALAQAALLAAGWLAWCYAPRPPRAATGGQAAHAATPMGVLWQPWRHSGFRRLMGVFVLNGIASAVAATLVLFFMSDRLLLPPAQHGMYLGAYFLSAALSMPLWVRLVPRHGLAPTWLAGMVLSVAVFVGAAALGAGDGPWFLLVCLLSGAALGADLALPSALLAGLVGRSGDAGLAGVYFGWWNLAAKLNLALAAGVALPLLGQWGYTPGTRDEAALWALTLAYAVGPCLLKLLAAASLYQWVIRSQPPSAAAVL